MRGQMAAAVKAARLKVGCADLDDSEARRTLDCSTQVHTPLDSGSRRSRAAQSYSPHSCYVTRPIALYRTLLRSFV